MESVDQLTTPILLGAIFAFAALAASLISSRRSIPAPAVFLAVGIAINAIWGDATGHLKVETVAQVGTVALVLILFEGGFTGGFQRMRGSIGPVLALGIVGTFATTAALAGAAHLVLDLSWPTCVLIAVALAPTDPAAVFSILGSRDVQGRSSAIIEGESGANDPVSIALMFGALAYYAGEGSIGDVAVTFVEQLLIGTAVGAIVGLLAGRALARARFRADGLFPVAALATAFFTFAAAALLGGSGFLAVLVAGLLMGDTLRAHRGIEALVALFSAIAEIVMFTMLGLVVNLGDVTTSLLSGLALFAILTFVVRPVVAIGLLTPARLAWGERAFIAWGGLKGAVPILLASFVVLDGTSDSSTIYAIVFVAVAASILVQGTSIPWLIDRLGLEAPDEATAGDGNTR